MGCSATGGLATRATGNAVVGTRGQTRLHRGGCVATGGLAATGRRFLGNNWPCPACTTRNRAPSAPGCTHRHHGWRGAIRRSLVLAVRPGIRARSLGTLLATRLLGGHHVSRRRPQPQGRGTSSNEDTECRLTGRSTGGATAGQPGRAAALVHHRPHGPAVLPRRPGYLYVRLHSARCEFSSIALASRSLSTWPRFAHFAVSQLRRAPLVAQSWHHLGPVLLRPWSTQGSGPPRLLRPGSSRPFSGLWSSPRHAAPVSSGGLLRPCRASSAFVVRFAPPALRSSLRQWVSLGWYASASGPWRAKCRCNLTCRSTGRATARHPGREAVLVHHPPHGRGASPPRAGYLYVRLHKPRDRACPRLAP